MEVRLRCRIIGMIDKVSVKDSGGKSWWHRCGTIGIDKEVEEMW